MQRRGLSEGSQRGRFQRVHLLAVRSGGQGRPGPLHEVRGLSLPGDLRVFEGRHRAQLCGNVLCSVRRADHRCDVCEAQGAGHDLERAGHAGLLCAGGSGQQPGLQRGAGVPQPSGRGLALSAPAEQHLQLHPERRRQQLPLELGGPLLRRVGQYPGKHRLCV